MGRSAAASGYDALANLRAQGFSVLAAHLSKSAVDYRDTDYTRPTAIVLGAELHGVSEEALRLADQQVSIPLAGMVRSLNVSVAAALILFEAKRQREAAGMYDRCSLGEEELGRRLFEWAYPSVARARREAGRPYPSLTPDGDIVRD